MAGIAHYARLALVAVALAAFFVQLGVATRAPSPFVIGEQTPDRGR
ncbi:hypothetical protein [Nitratireductor alexandrii]|nr:hypothetical protein [Nitratireductor alexandrii]